MKNVGVKDHEALVQHGSYSYTSPDGVLINVQYVADEGGFRATGDHLPTPPPIPAEIQKGLDTIFEQIRLQAVSKKYTIAIHDNLIIFKGSLKGESSVRRIYREHATL